jgi:glutathione synthase/RimK-type ligase-like ATP-grasp enzyme
VVELAERAARLFGDGLYGVDLKVVDGRPMLLEVNDNPNLDAGCEDGVLRDELYLAIMRHFRIRLDARGAPGGAA